MKKNDYTEKIKKFFHIKGKKNSEVKAELKAMEEKVDYLTLYSSPLPTQFEMSLDKTPRTGKFTPLVTTNTLENLSSSTNDSVFSLNNTKLSPSSLVGAITKSFSFDLDDGPSKAFGDVFHALDKKNSFDMVVTTCCSSTPKSNQGAPQALIREEKPLLLNSTTPENTVPVGYEVNLNKILEELLKKAALENKPLPASDSNLERLLEEIITKHSPEEAVKYVHTLAAASSKVKEGKEFLEIIMDFLNSDDSKEINDPNEDDPALQHDSASISAFSSLIGKVSDFFDV